MSNEILYYIIGIAGGLFALIVIAYIFLQKQMNKGDMKRIKQLKQGTQERTFTTDVIFQKLYVLFDSTPVIKRYLRKTRRKFEIIHIEDEYKTRKHSAKAIAITLVITIVLTIAIILFTHSEPLLMAIILFAEIFVIEIVLSGQVDSADTKLLKEQIDFFAAVRHAYHEFNMVEEAIYEVSQNDEVMVSAQGEKIYEILISEDPETELEKYYDVAPNSFLKEFAGISYLTKEFGDRTIDGASLYLRNLNNITQEMQLEILKRDKLDRVFQSLSVISILPILFIAPLKNWAINSFGFTAQFYNGKLGMIAQILLLIITFISFFLIRKIKDTGSIKDSGKDANKVWQMKLYKKPLIKECINAFIPHQNTKEYRATVKKMKEAASKQKIETLYVNKIVIFIAVFIISIVFLNFTHKVALDYIYNEPVGDYNVLGGLSEKDNEAGMEKRKIYNYFLDRFKGKNKITQEAIKKDILNSKYSETIGDIDKAAKDIEDELKVVNKENLRWYELLLCCVCACVGYMSPNLMLMFQKILRNLEMENEVMQFQTIIMMLMKIERVNVEIILEWIERYANIFKEPITKCVNNYEAGAWEALETLKEDIEFEQLIRLVESLQAAVEQIPISEAFDELDNERDYYQAKREDANNNLISKKGIIGKAIGFAPMICLFVGYLIIPLVVIGLTSMTQSFSTMSTIY